VVQHEQIAALILGAALSVIAGAGHMLPAEDPAAFIAAIRHWLA
jgi:pimeloyl-ACP methyl ester carboxylesterase